MGGISRLVGAGIGFTSEAIHAARNRNKDKDSGSEVASSSASVSASTPRGLPSDASTFPTTENVSRQESRDLSAEEELPAYSPGDRPQNTSDGDEKNRDLHEVDQDSDDMYGESVYRHDTNREDGGDEEAWQLDEMADALPTYNEVEGQPGSLSRSNTDNDPDTIREGDSEDTKEKKIERMVRNIVAMAGPPGPKTRLPYPVIIPQRRPGSKKRGFVNAYAPILEQTGISQEVFIKFINDFNKATLADLWIRVIVVTASIAGWGYMWQVSVAAIAVQTVFETVAQFQNRKRTTNFLDKINEELFIPRGQYCLIMKFKDQPDKPKKNASKEPADALGDVFSMEQVRADGTQVEPASPNPAGTGPSEFDAARTISKYTHTENHPDMPAWKQRMKGYRFQSGETHGDLALPESAPLIYPRIDKAAQREAEGKAPKTSFQNSRTWASDYWDRRRQMFFEAEHKGSGLAVPEEKRSGFTSRYNDPNHAANNGNLISALTGGLVKPGPSMFEKATNKMRERENRKRASQGLPPVETETLKEKIARKKKETGSRIRILREDVMYLMIVNMPTPEELEESVARARYMMEQEQQQKQKKKQKPQEI
ncbi:hypothetical protein N7520_006103 [Penicillium odoratum]|uniref:uncharacterized protein n=1 Tax=Penicillium odoratum TaxID=1167516 RepID=UPI002548D84A|nr:uncharacterized protein N7520_006103 [Penicillium odoratum]KAJ5758947.1 hypothetical protein N7520_006103 [Penicillium odoratum]